MFYRDYDQHWTWMAVLMPLFWPALIALTAWAMIRFTQGPAHSAPRPDVRTDPRETPQETLDRRFASGRATKRARTASATAASASEMSS